MQFFLYQLVLVIIKPFPFIWKGNRVLCFDFKDLNYQYDQ